MNAPRIFAQITKVDAAKREVWGRITQEIVDKSDEIFDYEGSKPYFQAWSEGIFKASDGKSYGNLRAMHGKVAAGKLIAIDFNDAEKAIDVGTKVVDEAEWTKCDEGVYTGFSIGGKYVGDRKTEKVDGRDVKRYIADPAEVSLVDNPCVSTATFQVVKLDGSTETKSFRAPSLEVTGSDDDVAAFADLLRTTGKSVAEANEVLKREFSAKEREDAADAGEALPDGSYPIKNKSDLHNAIQAYGRAKDKEKVKAHIKRRAKALGATDMLPEDWGKVATDELDKGMWNVQSFAECLACLANVCASAEGDAQMEGDGSKVPEKLRSWLGAGIAIFKEMSSEEADELLEDLQTQVGPDAEYAARLGALRKLSKRVHDPALTMGEFLELAKAHDVNVSELDFLGNHEALREAIIAKATKGDMAKHLQKIHDGVVKMGAACASSKSTAVDLTKAGTAGDQSQHQPDARDEVIKTLTARIEKLEGRPEMHPVTRVTLRATKKEQDTTPAPAALTAPAQKTDDPAPTLAPEDIIYVDGRPDYAASMIVKRTKLEMAAASQ